MFKRIVGRRLRPRVVGSGRENPSTIGKASNKKGNPGWQYALLSVRIKVVITNVVRMK